MSRESKKSGENYGQDPQPRGRPPDSPADRDVLDQIPGLQDRLAAALEAIRLGGRILQEFGRPQQIRAKAPRDLVTEVDLEVQRAIESQLRSSFPDDHLLGEETLGNCAERSLAGDVPYVWVIDPLDGTTNFVHGVPVYCLSVALLRQGDPVLGVIFDPCREECFQACVGRGAWLNDQAMHCSKIESADQALVACSFAAQVDPNSEELHQFMRVLPQVQAVRRTGSTALNLAYVAAGRFDAFWSISCQAWDVAAGMVLVREAAGQATSISGEAVSPLVDPRILACATPALHVRLKTLLELGV